MPFSRVSDLSAENQHKQGCRLEFGEPQHPALTVWQ